MHCKEIAVCWRTTLAHKLRTDYLQKLVTYQDEIINVHQKHGYVLGRVLRMNPQSFFDMGSNTAVYVKGSKWLLSKQQDKAG